MVEAACFVEKELRKVEVRFIGQTLPYKRNHLSPTVKIFEVHQKQNIFIKARTLLLKPHLIPSIPTLQAKLSMCKERKGSHAGTAPWKGHYQQSADGNRSRGHCCALQMLVYAFWHACK